MSRIFRYKESVNNFVKNKGCLNLIEVDDNIKKIINEHIADSQYLLPILILTISNNLNKKNKKMYQVYYLASSTELLFLYYTFITNAEYYNKKYGHEVYQKITNLVPVILAKSFAQNMEVVKKHLNDKNTLAMYTRFLNVFHTKLYELAITKVEITSKKSLDNDIGKYYIKDKNIELQKKYHKLSRISESRIDSIMETKICSLAEMTVMLGWIIGNGHPDNMKSVEKMGMYFGYLYKIALDFENIEDDIMFADGYTLNYVVNLGLQDSYEKYMENKHKFIEYALLLDTYTNTIKEIIDIIEVKVDSVVDSVKLDIKSQYSTLTNNTGKTYDS